MPDETPGKKLRVEDSKLTTDFSEEPAAQICTVAVQ